MQNFKFSYADDAWVNNKEKYELVCGKDQYGVYINVANGYDSARFNLDKDDVRDLIEVLQSYYRDLPNAPGGN